MKCAKCSFENSAGTTYCQNCGAHLKTKQKFFQWRDMKYLCGLTHRGVSIAPLGAMAVENQGKSLECPTSNPRKSFVKVQPRQDGTWYCPDCGELNQKYSQICKGCGRDFL
ncbi:MAG: zinc ribbon domain-containing protein [Eubacteriales bacterium]|nr:zinc ribbon domain-containing protein [Eubacteriales bacterium]